MGFLKLTSTTGLNNGKCSEENSPMLNNIINVVKLQLFSLCTKIQFDKSIKQVHCDEGETVHIRLVTRD